MEITHCFFEKGDSQILEVYNLLNEIENKQIFEAVNAQMEKGFINFVVDFSKMSYMNSVGLSFVIKLMLKLKKSKGQLILVGVNKTITQLFLVTKVYSMFLMKSTAEEGLKLLDRKVE